MLGVTDYVGLGTLITSTGTTIVAILVAWRQTGVKRDVEAVHTQVKRANGNTLGQFADTQEALQLAPLPTPAPPTPDLPPA